MSMKNIADRNDGNYEEVGEGQANGKSTLNSEDGCCPDGTHPSDYSVGKKPNDMHESESNGIVGVNR
jgi:hypothetical protein